MVGFGVIGPVKNRDRKQGDFFKFLEIILGIEDAL